MFLLLPTFALTQNTFFYTRGTQHEADSLGLILRTTTNDTLKMSICKDLTFYYSEINRDTALYFGEQQFALANKLGQKLWQSAALGEIGYVTQRLNNYPKSLISLTEAITIAEDEKNETGCALPNKFSGDGNVHNARLIILAAIYQQTGFLFGVLGINERATSNFQKALKVCEIVDDKVGLGDAKMNFGEFCLRANKLDSAYMLEKSALEISNISGSVGYQGFMLRVIGQVYLQKGNLDSAKTYLLNAVKVSQIQNNLADEADTYIPLAELYKITNQFDSSLYYAQKSLKIYEKIHVPAGINNAYAGISTAYQLLSKSDSAFIYLKIAKTFSDSLSKAEIQKIYQFQNIDFNYKIALQESEKKQMQEANTRKVYGLLSGLGLFSLLGIFLYRNNLQKQKANILLEKTLSTLKATQNQLIQSEKLASLGELTAGIAHEIQNPLNFVNNFSELSVDLTKDLNVEITKKPIDEAYVKELMNDLTDNQEKINRHGKRAASIVSGMLEHSRASTGKKELTDINKLTDEYFRLSFHGLRAKNKDFNAEMVTDFDTSIPKIEIIPQDVGRVILNLINNAFYAVNEKRILDNGRRMTDNGNKNMAAEIYSPTVTISTLKTENAIEIHVKDNGIGMSKSVCEKVFQPFFTTKPTGQGTGLGLSLAYDIITKGHAGELKVESTEGIGTEFIILFNEK